MHASNNKQRKFSLLRRLYRLDMSPNSSLLDHERIFDDLMQSLSAIGKTFEPDELIVLYANSLPNDTFAHWIQSQMAFIDNLSITEFKGHVREEARRLNLAGLSQGLGVERDPETIQANLSTPSGPSSHLPTEKTKYPGVSPMQALRNEKPL